MCVIWFTNMPEFSIDLSAIDFYFNSIVIREYVFLIPVKFMETFMTLQIVSW